MHPLKPLAASLVVVASACASAPLPAATVDAPALTVLDWNVNYGLAGDAAALAAIADEDADVVVLQETTPAWEAALRAALSERYPHMRFHHEGGAGGLAVLSKGAIVDDEVVPAVSWFPAWRGVIETPLGRVQVLDVHLRPPFDDNGSVVSGVVVTPAIRAKEAAAFVAALDGALDSAVATVIAGDFNEGSGGAIDVVKNHGFTSALERAGDSTPTWRWEGVPFRLRMDHVFYDDALVLTAAAVVDRGSSDHLPIRARFERAPPKDPSKQPSSSSLSSL